MMFRALPYGLILSSLVTGFTQAQELDLLATSENLELVNVAANEVEYKGLPAIHLSGTRQNAAPDVGNRSGSLGVGTPRPESLAIVKGTDFQNGTIEVELAGLPSQAAGANARGFVGIAFHVEHTVPIAYDCFYLRPTNGRAEDQLRRNHSCQYMSHPDAPFNVLRAEFPGVYESYVDLIPGEWTKVKIEVAGEKARLFVNGAAQPCLLVNDLRRAGKAGPIALWLEQSTDAYFRNLVVTQKD